MMMSRKGRIDFMGFYPIPHFILCLDAKNEARKIKTKRLPTRSAARQEFLIKVVAAIVNTEIHSNKYNSVLANPC